MDYENEIIRLRRLNMKMYFTMSNIISVLNNRETDELYKLNMKSIDKDMIFNDNIDKEILLEIRQLKEEIKNLRYELFNSVNYLMKKELERDIEKELKFFEYSDCESDNDSCGCGKEPQKPCEEIEEYLKNIKMVD